MKQRWFNILILVVMATVIMFLFLALKQNAKQKEALIVVGEWLVLISPPETISPIVDWQAMIGPQKYEHVFIENMPPEGFYGENSWPKE